MVVAVVRDTSPSYMPSNPKAKCSKTLSRWWHINWPLHTKIYNTIHIWNFLYAASVCVYVYLIHCWGKFIQVMFRLTFEVGWWKCNFTLALCHFEIIQLCECQHQNNVRACAYVAMFSFFSRVPGHFRNRNSVNGQINLILTNRKVTKKWINRYIECIASYRIDIFCKFDSVFPILWINLKIKRLFYRLYGCRIWCRNIEHANHLCKFRQIFSHTHKKGFSSHYLPP